MMVFSLFWVKNGRHFEKNSVFLTPLYFVFVAFLFKTINILNYQAQIFVGLVLHIFWAHSSLRFDIVS